MFSTGFPYVTASVNVYALTQSNNFAMSYYSKIIQVLKHLLTT